MDSTFARALELLNSGHAPETVIRELQPANVREALKRCAAVNSFDRGLLETVLLTDLGQEPPPFEDVIASTDVEVIPAPPGWYRLREAARREYWLSWWHDGVDEQEVPTALAELAQRLVEHYETTGAPDTDLLAALVLVDRQRAKALFDKCFAAADHTFQLARCQDLVDVLTSDTRTPLLDQDLFAHVQRRAAYLQARSMWSTEYLQTGTFLETPGTSAEYRTLLEPGGEQILEVHARGGQGKTMERRWFISRVLVPEHIPCAVTDFDFVDLANAAKYPWLVLVDIAAQLDQQLIRSPFTDFLAMYGWAAPLLQRRASSESRAAASNKVQSQADDLHGTVVNHFVRTFGLAMEDRTAVMLFDTLEELHLRTDKGLDGLVSVVHDVHKRCSTARFVLAGRYPLEECTSIALPRRLIRTPKRFSRDDAERYLTSRALGDAEVRTAVAEKANGRPFTLALLADLVQQRPALPPDSIRKFEADLIYLVQRVIDRIPEPRIRWLLRYGVVPRGLTFEFVAEVMDKYLRKGMSGDNEVDDPTTDELPEQANPDSIPFQTDLLTSVDAPLPLHDLWEQLRRYASTSSWVSERAGELSFHSDVREPMRRLIRQKKIYRRLHEDAARYFEQRAEQDPTQWVRWTREAVFHRFQLEGAKAAGYWRAALDRVELGDSEARRLLAEELLGADYLDNESTPRRREDSGPVIDLETVIEARYEVAAASVQEARVLGVVKDDQLWSRAVEQVTLVNTAKLDVPPVPWHKLAYVEAALMFQQGHADNAEGHVRAALPSARGTQDEVRFHVLLGDIKLERGDDSAPGAYRRAVQVAARLSARRWEPSLRRRVVLALQRLGNHQEAMRELDKALAYDDIPSDVLDELELTAVELGFATGRLSWAESHAKALEKRGNAKAAALRARLLLASHRIPIKIGQGDLVERELEHRFNVNAEVAGLTAAALGYFQFAELTLEEACQDAIHLGNLTSVARCHLHLARLQMREAGNYSDAERHLDKAITLRLRTGSEIWVDVRLARVELHGLQGKPNEGRSALNHVIEVLRRRWCPPGLLVRTVVEGLALGPAGQSLELLDLLHDQLRLVTPASARLVLLTELRRVNEMHTPDLLAKLRTIRSLLSNWTDGLSDLDLANLDFVHVELDRLTGSRRVAEERLASIRLRYRDVRPRYFFREWALAHDRLASISSTVRPDGRTIDLFLKDFQSCPTLCLAFLVERAEAQLANGHGRQAKSLVNRAAKRQKDAEKSQWQARLSTVMAGAMRLQEQKRDKWRPYIAAAAAIFAALGNTMRTREAQRELPGPAAELDLPRCRSRITMSPDGDVVEVETFVPPSTRSESRVPTNGPLLRALGGGEPTRLAETLTDTWPALGVVMGEALLPSAALDQLIARGSPLDFRCDIEDRRFDPVPWELGFLHGSRRINTAIGTFYRTNGTTAAQADEARYLQIALRRLVEPKLVVDGVIGAHTIKVLRAYWKLRKFKGDPDLDQTLLERLQSELRAEQRPGVLIVSPATTSSFHSTRSRMSSAAEIAWVYERHGFDVTYLRKPALPHVSGTLQWMRQNERAPMIVHITGALKPTSNGAVLTFPPTSDELSATAMDRLLSYATTADEVGPMVVLDVESPANTVDLAQYLLLRNGFAGELFALGRCSGVLGTGLADADRHWLTTSMVSSFANGKSIGETSRELRCTARADTTIDRMLSFAGTALHTHLPWLRFTAVGADDPR